MNMKDSDYCDIKKDIRFYARDMNQWWKNLQKDSVAEWLLLTTIGCWGIPNHLFQMLAFILTILFFTGKLKTLQRKYSFVKSEKMIFGKIMGNDFSVKEREILLYRLDKIKKFRRNRNIIFILKRNWRFIFGYTFLMVSFVYNL
ncbi:putative membrane protein [Pectobacterium atrosepticum SCRI1043]|uniref:Membrane protein n=3 Tax=Pectobacterium atrosepticum TaxID=29471 RepID=Q6D9G5_PECAS|nr:hypothetical protein EV46_02840 [Pectobacterium atrosepticum]KMK80052.1 hypothetical protein KCQ_11145 [Pectobacterium atrosepticum ICMP 1526]CAG73565.1 putative membrane protein [Pectobacterium atrosepticum SCRI1043]GKV85695.1 hypothetical protein PEC301296_20070 [Pectobacterium carotovorum subsp. carotovorum]AIK12454.1 putative membrane protein [Pectobacterium atrosepticum]